MGPPGEMVTPCKFPFSYYISATIPCYAKSGEAPVLGDVFPVHISSLFLSSPAAPGPKGLARHSPLHGMGCWRRAGWGWGPGLEGCPRGMERSSVAAWPQQASLDLLGRAGWESWD